MRAWFSLRLIVLLGAAVALLSWLYHQSTAVDPEQHLAFVSTVRTLKQLDANLNQDVLRARFNLLAHYDPLITTLDQLRNLARPLATAPLAVHLRALDPRLQNDVSAILAATETKATQIEQFKSRNAVFNNSLRYFPLLTTQLVEHGKTLRQARLNDTVEQVERDVLVLNLTGGRDMEPEIRDGLVRLRALQPALPAPLPFETAAVIRHAEVILETKHDVDQITEQILAAPLPRTVDALSRAYDRAHGQAMHRSGLYRTALYALAVLLLGYVFYAIARVKLGALDLAKANRQLREEIEERQRTQDQLSVSREVIAAANDAIAVLDPHLRFEEFNAAHCRLTECDAPCTLTGEPLQTLLSPDDMQRVLSAIEANGSFRGEITYRLKNGKAVEIEMSLFALRQERAVQHYVTILRDISERKNHLCALEFQATHDMLTGLPNRTLLYDTLNQSFGNTRGPIGLMLLDLDRFKEINDTLGHQAGDEVLRQVASRLEGTIQQHGLIARLGGDEFAIMVPNLTHGDQVLNFAERILADLRQPIALTELNIEIGGSIGIARFPDHGNNPSQLMRCADVAMYLAKESGAGFALYQPNLDQHTPRRLSIMTGLGQAIEQDQFRLQFQPKLDLTTGTVSGFEALLRWRHPEHGMIPPDQFIPLAEMSDLIGPLTLWVVDHAMAQIKTWRRTGFTGSVAVNFSARNFLDDQLPQKIMALLRKHDLPTSCFELEITESAMMADPTRSLQIMRRIQDLGLKLAIDDYGTGHSSLAYLQRLPIHSLKIDLSFVRSMLANKENEVIVHSTIQLAHNLGLNVIAEGVEDEATLAKLQAFACDEVQGYFISRPMDATQAGEWLAARPA